MPRLSIIIPHRSDDLRLEETLLSVLENRPRDCEIIVAHDGSYHDPYRLADEVVYVQEDPDSSIVDLLNAGVMAACSPVVCMLLDGVLVSPNWSESALKRFARADVDAVAPQLQVGKKIVAGIAASGLRSATKLRGKVESSDAENAVSPVLSAGFYRRKVLLALGGWNAAVGSGAADIELALLMKELERVCECEPTALVTANASCLPDRTSKASSFDLACVAVAYGLAAKKWTAAVSAVLTGGLTGRLGSSLSWAAGLLDNRVCETISARVELAKKQLGLVEEASSIKLHDRTAVKSQPVATAHRKAA